MKYIDLIDINTIDGKRLDKQDRFLFDCHRELSCFNQCCHNLNLILYPYDIIRIKNRLEISSDQFLDIHVDSVLRNNNYFPDIFLRMKEDEKRSCPFLTDQGCFIYSDRPGTCRMFPIEQAVVFNGQTGTTEDIYFFRPPPSCLGTTEKKDRTISSWIKSQDALSYVNQSYLWAGVKRLFQTNPFGKEGINGSKGKMAFMSIYNIDMFRQFIFDSSFLKRYRIPHKLLKKIRSSDTELLQLGYDWVKTYLWGISSPKIVLR